MQSRSGMQTANKPINIFDEYIIKGGLPKFAAQQQKGYVAMATDLASRAIGGADLAGAVSVLYKALHNKLSDAAIDKIDAAGIMEFKEARQELKNEYENFHKLIEVLCNGVEDIDKKDLKQICDVLVNGAKTIDGSELEVDVIKGVLNNAAKTVERTAGEIELKQKLAKLDGTLKSYSVSISKIDSKVPKTFVEHVVGKPFRDIVGAARGVFHALYKNPFRSKDELANSNDKKISELDEMAAGFKALEDKWLSIHKKILELCKLPSIRESERVIEELKNGDDAVKEEKINKRQEKIDRVNKLNEEIANDTKELQSNLKTLQDFLSRQKEDKPLKELAVKLLANVLTMAIKMVIGLGEYIRCGAVDNRMLMHIRTEVGQAISSSRGCYRVDSSQLVDNEGAESLGARSVKDLRKWKDEVGEKRNAGQSR
ncbi:hypothetical protein Cyrtocomes_00130 [Candidatus Cyrtobacter comes]|uniref:Uncharacterized protein n=1 Tax=Candidatus Cyrtobacter comes TaxID=675776 RepID=A0ABU5L6L7_9RICK|nr:hypothetical protein [Candidatus Cyrtobacter comes]MDZ5761772.1 hypothetical protein [Candidatus Cyrtobacter comes]